ncbi:DUF4421 family protein [Aurantibacillus circumpalustris]|uniref:DUF4421 family protein n=1 Tax=Aurantibacillus circumpalustris TaxID=3036359 RepID=UPI00295AA2E0|nr:DUF4421 family protein [Aurantibacillus circumpalustris]
MLFRVRIVLVIIVLGNVSPMFSQADSLVKTLIDTVVSKLIVDDIPRKTFKDKFMYPHRWYVKQMLKSHTSDIDTTYVRSVKKKLVITVALAKKFYGFNLVDLETKKELDFAPNNYYHVGFNFNNIIFSFGFYPGIKFGSKPNSGNTKSIDIQTLIMGRRVITDIYYQNYRGFYVLNSDNYLNKGAEGSYIFVRPDLKVFAFGVNTMFIFNYKKYSMRGSFSYTDIQKKNAASLMAGIYHKQVTFRSVDSTLIGLNTRDGLTPDLFNINSISLLTIGISGGYGYTLVYRKFIASNIINIGIGGQKTNYTTTDGKEHSLSLNPSLHLNVKGAIRYDKVLYFVGIMASYDTDYTSNPNLFNVETYTSKVLLFVGYRFNIKQNGRKVLKAMGLVDFKT